MSAAHSWPPGPLIAAVGLDLRGTARALGIDPANLCRPLTDRQADTWAVRLGLHPAQVWGSLWWAEPEDLL